MRSPLLDTGVVVVVVVVVVVMAIGVVRFG